LKTIVLGIDNTILDDDNVRIDVSQELKKHIKDRNIKIDYVFNSGMNPLDLIIDQDRAILIDAIRRRDSITPGEVDKFELGELTAFHTKNLHDLSLPNEIDITKKLGEKNIPKDISLLGINIGDITNEFGETFSKKIGLAVPKSVDLVKKEVKKNE